MGIMKKAATIGISLHSPTAVAGTTVWGEIHVDVRKEIRGAAWEVTLRGREHTNIRVKKNNRHRATRELIHLQQLLLDHTSSMIQSENGNKIAPGKYILPFKFELPSNIPTSLSIVDRRGDHGSVEYSIKAILKGSGTLWNYHCERIIPVCALPLPIAAVPHNGPGVINESVKSCRLFHKGSITLGARLDDMCLDRGSILSMSLSCRNHTTGRIQSIRAKLRQTIIWKLDGGLFYSHHISVSKTLVALDFTQALRKELEPPQHKRPLLAHTDVEAIQQEVENVSREVNQGTYWGELHVPLNQAGILNSYKGSLVEIQHELVIKVDTGCMRSNPKITIPVRVGEPRTAVEAVEAVEIERYCDYPVPQHF